MRIWLRILSVRKGRSPLIKSRTFLLEDLIADPAQLYHLSIERSEPNMRRIAIVGSKSLLGNERVYKIIDDAITNEMRIDPRLIIVNGGEEGVDEMAGEVAISHGLGYEVVPLEKCTMGCSREYCFEHSYKPRSFAIADQSDKIYRIYDESCGTSTCEVTAKFGDTLGKSVVRIPIDLLFAS